MQRAVTVIPAKQKLPFNVLSNEARRRVAGYARVSTNEEEQLTSYEAQVDYYTKHIQSNPEWEFVEVYTDEGISATSTKKRDGFNRMIRDALDGKIDLIITKSVSRFARNTVDTLTTVRKLKEKGIEVYFEKENIYTLDSKGELLITIMSSLAQEESRSISENVTWGMRKRFSDGKVSVPYKQFLGYEKGADGFPSIVEEEAEIVRLIYRLFLYGKSPSFIASLLTDEGVLTPGGKAKWRPNVIISILTNEKYKGDAILQKRFTLDFLTKKMKVNEGEVPQYLVRNSHPAIIEPELFDLVQFEMNRRAQSGRWGTSSHVFSGKIFCGECGGMYGPKTWHSTDEYRRVVWQCNGKYAGGKRCAAPHLTDSQIQAAFLAAFNARLDNKAEIFEAYDEVLRILTDNSALNTEAAALTEECEVVMELTRKCVQENATAALDQNEYQRRYDGLAKRYEATRARLAEIDAARLERGAKRTNITRFLKTLVKQGDDIVAEFDEELWYITVDFITVHADGRLTVTFRDGFAVEIEQEIWRAA
jgi:DNA invertase Pin-like site-specific DNA recombinase